MSDWHGWGRRKRTLHVGPLPGRKSIALYTMDYRDGAAMYVHAYFRSEAEAQRALETLDSVVSPNTEEHPGE